MLAARHRARLAMQDDNGDTREGFASRNLRNRSVRRRLFVDDEDNEGSEDRQGLNENRTNELFEEARSNLKKAKDRWNFDFETETPLPGNYVWVKLDKNGKEVENSFSDVQESDRGIDEMKHSEKFETAIETNNIRNKEFGDY